MIVDDDCNHTYYYYYYYYCVHKLTHDKCNYTLSFPLCN